MTPLVVTDGIVLGKRGAGEANTLLAILTREHGLLKASAKSARRERSKLRYALEPLTAARYSLVQGMYEWKVVGAEGVSKHMPQHRSGRAAAGRIARLLMRLIHGEEPAPALYCQVADGLPLLSHAHSDEELASIECVLVLRVLFSLGYLPHTPELAPFIADGALTLPLAAQAAARRSALIRAINDSLSATGL